MKAHDFPDVYKWLGINLNQLGCVMLPLEPIALTEELKLPLYKSPNPERHWIDGWVAGRKAHLTLLYGLLAKAPNIESHIRKVLENQSPLDTVAIDHIGYFPSPYEDEKYWCIVAFIVPTGPLLEAHQRLSFLPHINTFPVYTPHMTLGYIDPVSEEERDKIIAIFHVWMRGLVIKVAGDIDLGRS